MSGRDLLGMFGSNRLDALGERAANELGGREVLDPRSSIHLGAESARHTGDQGS